MTVIRRVKMGTNATRPKRPPAGPRQVVPQPLGPVGMFGFQDQITDENLHPIAGAQIWVFNGLDGTAAVVHASDGSTLAQPMLSDEWGVFGYYAPPGEYENHIHYAGQLRYVQQVQLGPLLANPPDGDKGDITVSGSGASWQIDPGAVGTPEIADGSVTTAKLAPGAVPATAWGTITGTLSAQTDLQAALNGKAGLATANSFSADQTFNAWILTSGYFGANANFYSFRGAGGVGIYAGLTSDGLNVTGTVTGSNLSGTNTGDETRTTILTKLVAPGGTTQFLRADGTWAAPPGGTGGGGLTDGDKGDVVVSGGGTALTVESAHPASGMFPVTGDFAAYGTTHSFGVEPASGVDDNARLNIDSTSYYGSLIFRSCGGSHLSPQYIVGGINSAASGSPSLSYFTNGLHYFYTGIPDYGSAVLRATIDSTGINIPTGATYKINGVPIGGGGGGLTDGDKGDVVVGGGGTTLTVESATPAGGTFAVTGKQTIVPTTGVGLTINTGNQTSVDAINITNVGPASIGLHLTAADGAEFWIAPKASGDSINNQINIAGGNRSLWFEVFNNAYDASPHAFMFAQSAGGTRDIIRIKNKQVGGTNDFLRMVDSTDALMAKIDSSGVHYAAAFLSNTPLGFFGFAADGAMQLAAGIAVGAYLCGRGGTYDVSLGNRAGTSVVNILAGTTTTSFAGLVLTPASAAGGAGFRLPPGAAPTAPVNGDIWTTTAGLFARINGVTVQNVFGGAITTSGLTMNTARLLGRTSASVGAPEELTAAQAKTFLGIVTTDVAAVAGNVVSVNASAAAAAYSELAMAANTFVGRGASGNIVACTLGATLAFAGAALGVVSVPSALTMNNGGAGAASGGTFNGSAAVTLSWNTLGAAPDTPRIQSVASAATVTPTFSNDLVAVTAQAVNLTLANPTGTAVDGWGLVIRIKAAAVGLTLTFGANYRAIGVTLPTGLINAKTLILGMIYNNADTKWDVTAVAQEA